MAGPTPGQVLNGRYELRRRIGGGSMGEVWRGRDLVLGRTVAVKIVLPALLDEPTFRARFVAEARVMAMMDHPGIVGVFDYGYAETDDPDTPGAAFLVMEFIEGESLDKILTRTGPLEPRFALKVLASLLDALAAVHRVGVVHRDVKPANVMLTSGGVVLADFGIARSAESLGLTAADALMGTVPYLAPELFQAETPTPAADVYAVGILGYELLSGRQPFQAASTAAVMYKHMHEPPPPLPDYVAAPAAELLWRALEKDSGRRWTDGADMGAALRRVLEGPVEVGEEYAAGLDYGRGHAGNASGYEDTLTESGLRRARGGSSAGAGYEEPVGGFEQGVRDSLYSDGTADPGGRHGRSPYEDSYGDSLDRSDPLADSGGRHGRAAAFGEDAASDIGGRHGRSAFEETAALDVAETARLTGLPDAGGRRGRAAFDETARMDETARLSALSDSGGRRGRTGRTADAPEAPDATRVFDAESAGRHAGPTSEIPLRRRAAEPGAVPGVSGPPNGRGASPASRTDAARRRTLVLTAAVAAPALLGLTVALVVNASGSSPSSGGSGTGPGAAHNADLPTSYGTSSEYGTPYAASSSSSAYYPHSAPGHGHGSGTSSTGTPSAPGFGARSSASSAPFSSLTGPPSSAASSTGVGSTPTSTAPGSPTSTTSSPSAVPVSDVTGKSESQARTTLTGQGFQVAVGAKDGTGTSCTVMSQSPGGTMSAAYGSTVTINLTCT